MQSNEEGFTLVELIVVMVIIGILAATALPRLGDLQGVAKETKISEFESGLEAAVEGIHAKAMIQNTKTVTWEDESITLEDNYYPSNGSVANLFDMDDLAFSESTESGLFNFQGASGCYVKYNYSSGSYNITTNTSGCN